MKKTVITLSVSALALASACAPITRSRNVGNPAVPATAIAEQVCSNCHTVTGNSNSPNFPRLVAMPAPYLEAQLKLFRSHGRTDPPGYEYMWGLSHRLTDEQIAGLAKYFSSQTPVPNHPGPADLAARGQKIYEDGIPEHNIPPCKACHGDHGEGHDLFPRLAGQYANYTEAQLGVFKYRVEQRPDAGPMQLVAHDLTADNARAVAAYVQGLR